MKIPCITFHLLFLKFGIHLLLINKMVTMWKIIVIKSETEAAPWIYGVFQDPNGGGEVLCLVYICHCYALWFLWLLERMSNRQEFIRNQTKDEECEDLKSAYSQMKRSMSVFIELLSNSWMTPVKRYSDVEDYVKSRRKSAGKDEFVSYFAHFGSVNPQDKRTFCRFIINLKLPICNRWWCPVSLFLHPLHFRPSAFSMPLKINDVETSLMGVFTGYISMPYLLGTKRNYE